METGLYAVFFACVFLLRLLRFLRFFLTQDLCALRVLRAFEWKPGLRWPTYYSIIMTLAVSLTVTWVAMLDNHKISGIAYSGNTREREWR